MEYIQTEVFLAWFWGDFDLLWFRFIPTEWLELQAGYRIGQILIGLIPNHFQLVICDAKDTLIVSDRLQALIHSWLRWLIELKYESLL